MNNTLIDITNPVIVYLLGLFWADCYFGRSPSKNTYEFSLEMKKSDFIPIWSLLREIGFTKYAERVRKNSAHPQCNARCARQKDLQFFLKYRFDHRKEGCPLYFALSEKMKPFFIKGFLDGDGSVSVDKNNVFRVCFYGAYEQSWDFLEDFCKRRQIQYVIYNKTRAAHHESHTKEHSYSVFEFTRRHRRIEFCRAIEHVSIGLQRKLDVYKKLTHLAPPPIAE